MLDTREFFKSLDLVQVVIYRRPDFLADDFEYESYLGQGILRNMFKYQKVDETTDSIFLPFPERWINCIECHQLFPRLQQYYPNLKKLKIKTHQPLIITYVPNVYAFRAPGEDEICKISGGYGHINKPTSVEDELATFKGISEGKIFTV